ncbi:MAG: Poly(hydroxyalcanoate) granule associated protein (phasin) [Proteobacteria bacterium]|jgi:poly(hydroxyalkanoate) granule-associated protein|nr:Poly(hydroxyalcanoate) granule associated protein (phasin) [Pseudomonadota bacterium]MBS1223956.1 Poly(hydroxyalcanoate) granule associated protein (phasin) [Pseudomonadota bacterium]
MAYQQLQRCLRETRKVEDTLALASQIWLAGIGALARAQQEGHEFFDQLVQCGEVVEAIEEDDGLRELKELARLVLAGPGVRKANTPTPDEILSLAEMIQHFDLHLNELEMR